MNKIFLGIGSNLGNREANLKEAVAMITKYIGLVSASSSVYETEPWGFRSENQFLNMVAEAGTELSPIDLMEAILLIEAKIGRTRSEKQYSSRIIDIDIILYNDLILDVDDLRIPHPKMYLRRFVLVPLCELAPELVHPVLKKTMTSLLKICNNESRVKFYSKPLSAKL